MLVLTTVIKRQGQRGDLVKEPWLAARKWPFWPEESRPKNRPCLVRTTPVGIGRGLALYAENARPSSVPTRGGPPMQLGMKRQRKHAGASRISLVWSEYGG